MILRAARSGGSAISLQTLNPMMCIQHFTQLRIVAAQHMEQFVREQVLELILRAGL